MELLPLETQTLYAELMDRLAADAAARSVGDLTGSFLTKQIKGKTYWYFQHAGPGGRRRQLYLGADSPGLRRLAERFREERHAAAGRDSQRLCAMLARSGVHVPTVPVARVLRALVEGSVFSVGGVLVGTHAFGLMGNLLGVRWAGGSLHTQDVDIAVGREIEIGVPELRADVPAVLETLEMGFLPVPPLDPGQPSTSYKVRGLALRVDLLTSSRGTGGGPVPIPRLNAAAYPMPFLDYLIEDARYAAVIAADGFLVRIPDPARFALHKLALAAERPVAFEAKAAKDLAQAAQLLSFLGQNRPGDLLLAHEAAARGGRFAARIAEGLARLAQREPDVAAHAQALFGPAGRG